MRYRYVITVDDSTSDRRLHSAHVGARGRQTARAQHVQGMIPIALETGKMVDITTTDDPDYSEIVNRD